MHAFQQFGCADRTLFALQRLYLKITIYVMIIGEAKDLDSYLWSLGNDLATHWLPPVLRTKFSNQNQG